MRLSARVDYAVRACVVLARDSGWHTSESVAHAQDIPARFLEAILRDLRRADLVESRRGRDGGHRLARAADLVSVADVIRATDGPLAVVNGLRPDELTYGDDTRSVQQLWLALRAAERACLEGTTVADLASGVLPDQVLALLDVR